MNESAFLCIDHVNSPCMLIQNVTGIYPYKLNESCDAPCHFATYSIKDSHGVK
jgi:hypothetical protein